MPTIPEEIIVRSIQKTAGEEDMKILNKWLKEDKKNVEYYFQLEEIWHSKMLLTEESLLEGWQRLSREVEHLSQQKPISTRLQRSKVLITIRYAAAVVIGVLIASAIWLNLPTKQQSIPEPEVLVQNVLYNQTGVQAILLPDSSQVWVNENTKITYPEKFAKNQREISLEGKAYFDIRKKSEVPFVVHIGDINVEVTGTEFFIEEVQGEETQVTLVSGGVNLIYKDQAGETTSSSIIPGQQAVINKSSGDIKIADVDTDYYVVWKDGVYSFNDEYLDKIIELFARRFNLDIQISASLKKKRFTGKIRPNESVQEVLITINKSYPIKYKITGNTIKISEH
ncbi:MAG: FecR family protein [Tannerella sp.]|jgi:ferric-dicitrate binding protein FerR (iron transport regulator)|nr:FecR family protein [Tannerella sp.]